MTPEQRAALVRYLDATEGVARPLWYTRLVRRVARWKLRAR